MTGLFIRLYKYFRDHQAVCWLSMVSLFVFLGYFATSIHLEEDIDKLMPASKNEDGTTKLAFANLRIKEKGVNSRRKEELLVFNYELPSLF